MARLNLRDNDMCFACGQKNRIGLKLTFEMNARNELTARFKPTQDFQGFQDILHGGIMALLLDEIIVNLTWRLGLNAVTGSMNLRLRRPAKIGEEITLRGRILRQVRRLIHAKAEALNARGELLAEAKSICVRVKPFNKRK